MMTEQKKMQGAQRQTYILERIKKSGFVTIAKIAHECGASEMTMRRDLDRLAERKLIDRIHGGAVAPTTPEFDSIEPRLESRTELNRAGKISIAQQAAAKLSAGQTVALDVGTTTFELARQIADMPINVFTASLKIATYLNDRRANVYLPGGMVSGTDPSVIGSQAIKQLEKLRFDIAFIGVSGVSDEGFYDYSIEDTEIKKTLIKNAQNVIILVDGSKFDRTSVAHVCAFESVDVIITDCAPSEKLRSIFEACSIQVEIATPEHEWPENEQPENERPENELPENELPENEQLEKVS